MTGAPTLLAISLFMDAAARAPGLAAPERMHADVALGFGTMVDRKVPGGSDMTLVPAFFFSLAAGGPSFGAAFQFMGAGRNASEDSPNRQVVDISVLFRPGARLAGAGETYAGRVLRSFALAAGPAYERIGKVGAAVSRFGLRTGAHVDLPLEPPNRSEARLRVAVRRMWGGTVRFGDLDVTDSAGELVLFLAVLF